jgi:hypothetical protein
MVKIRMPGCPFIPLDHSSSSVIQRLSFNEEFVDQWTGVVDSVHHAMNLFHAFFNRKINPKFWKLAETQEFYI